MPIRAVIFDLFDTLVDLLGENLPQEEYRGRSLPILLRRIHGMVEEYVAVDFDRYLTIMKEVDEEFRESHYARNVELPSLERFEVLARRLGATESELPHALVEVHMGALFGQVEYLDHHPEILARLKGDYLLGLCSNFSHSPTASRVLEVSELGELFDAIVISDAVGIRKPDPVIFEQTLDALGVAPEEALHVGDSLRADVGGASAVGIRTVWLTRRIADPEKVLGSGTQPRPDFQISDLAELPSLLEREDLRK
jgi:putative hydrolase of the HAD superfamily